MSTTLITKADGEREPFDPSKLEHSLEKAGASSIMRAQILSHVMKELKPGMMTEEIYRHAFDMLSRQEETPVAARYSMKRAVFALGPSGFPFERFLGEVLRAHGWQVRSDITLMGRCAPHEVDVLAEKNGKRVGIEAKFHNDPGGKTDIKDALYVHARYHDLGATADPSSHVDEGWLVTNTRFTRNAIRYAQCANLTLLGWDYPTDRGLLQMINEARVHPLTSLTTLTEGQKRELLAHNIVLCKDVQTPHLLQEYGVRPESIPKVMDEAKRLCGV
ncbi:MAG TPA: restriction endonuclease [Candidatus Paceibacterota bacterium]|nr:restriction endonuclease [Candidatus Paceibacterota bacterium]